LGAKTLFANSEVTPTNPFAIDDKPENRIFVKQFLLLLAESGGFAVSAKEQREIDSCIDVLFLQEKENRSLAVALSGLHESALSRFLQKWLDGEKSSYFNGRDDLCSVDEDFFYIDMTDILKDRELYPAYILYLLNRIKYAVENNVDGRPIFIFIEEAWRYLSIPEIQVELNALVPVLRRQGGLIVFITQSLNQLTENINLTRNIVNNSQNILVFRSDELERGAKTKNLMDLLEIKDTEYEAFVQRQPSERFFLYKDRSNNNSALCKVDLRGMEKILPILSANAEKNRFFYDNLYGKIKPEFALKEYLQNF
jgi:type IV secretion system protein VirB4